MGICFQQRRPYSSGREAAPTTPGVRNALASTFVSSTGVRGDGGTLDSFMGITLAFARTSGVDLYLSTVYIIWVFDESDDERHTAETRRIRFILGGSLSTMGMGKTSNAWDVRIRQYNIDSNLCCLLTTPYFYVTYDICVIPRLLGSKISNHD